MNGNTFFIGLQYFFYVFNYNCWLYHCNKGGAMHNFGNRLKESLAKKGTTQVALSEYMDISPQAVQKWAAGNTPTLDNIVKIADFLGVSPAWLLFGETGSSDDLLVAVPEYDIKFSCGNGVVFLGKQKALERGLLSIYAT